MRATIEGLSAELRVPAEAFREVFGEAFREGCGKGYEKVSGSLAIYDPEACCLYVPNFVKYQAAESPNVIKAWAKTREYIPECGLKTLAVSGVKAYVEGLGEGFRKAFREAFGKALREDMGESVNSKQGAVIPSRPSQAKGFLTHLSESVHGGADRLKNEQGGDDEF